MATKNRESWCRDCNADLPANQPFCDEICRDRYWIGVGKKGSKTVGEMKRDVLIMGGQLGLDNTIKRY